MITNFNKFNKIFEEQLELFDKSILTMDEITVKNTVFVDRFENFIQSGFSISAIANNISNIHFIHTDSKILNDSNLVKLTSIFKFELTKDCLNLYLGKPKTSPLFALNPLLKKMFKSITNITLIDLFLTQPNKNELIYEIEFSLSYSNLNEAVYTIENDSKEKNKDKDKDKDVLDLQKEHNSHYYKNLYNKQQISYNNDLEHEKSFKNKPGTIMYNSKTDKYVRLGSDESSSLGYYLCTKDGSWLGTTQENNPENDSNWTLCKESSNNEINEIGPKMGSLAFKPVFDQRAEKLKYLAIKQVISSKFSKELPFLVKTHSSNIKPLQYDLIDVKFKELGNDKLMYLSFHNKDGIDNDAPFADNKLNITFTYDMNKDEYIDNSANYKLNSYAVNFLITAANLLREMHYTRFPLYKNINNKHEIDIEATENAKKSKLTKDYFSRYINENIENSTISLNDMKIELKVKFDNNAMYWYDVYCNDTLIGNVRRQLETISLDTNKTGRTRTYTYYMLSFQGDNIKTLFNVTVNNSTRRKDDNCLNSTSLKTAFTEKQIKKYLIQELTRLNSN